MKLYFFFWGKLKEVLETITLEISKLKRWFDRNKLALNINQTNCMLFGNCKKCTQVQIQIDGVDIKRVNENKFLGVIIDEN